MSKPVMSATTASGSQTSATAAAQAQQKSQDDKFVARVKVLKDLAEKRFIIDLPIKEEYAECIAEAYGVSRRKDKRKDKDTVLNKPFPQDPDVRELIFCKMELLIPGEIKKFFDEGIANLVSQLANADGMIRGAIQSKLDLFILEKERLLLLSKSNKAACEESELGVFELMKIREEILTGKSHGEIGTALDRQAINRINGVLNQNRAATVVAIGTAIDRIIESIETQKKEQNSNEVAFVGSGIDMIRARVMVTLNEIFTRERRNILEEERTKAAAKPASSPGPAVATQVAEKPKDKGNEQG